MEKTNKGANHGIMENKMETTITGYIGFGVYRVYKKTGFRFTVWSYFVRDWQLHS